MRIAIAAAILAIQLGVLAIHIRRSLQHKDTFDTAAIGVALMFAVLSVLWL